MLRVSELLRELLRDFDFFSFFDSDLADLIDEVDSCRNEVDEVEWDLSSVVVVVVVVMVSSGVLICVAFDYRRRLIHIIMNCG